jgi:hypothetical protein
MEASLLRSFSLVPSQPKSLVRKYEEHKIWAEGKRPKTKRYRRLKKMGLTVI